jgi:hypothetical protein
MSTVPISDNTPRNQYVATAGQTAFVFDYWVNDAADLLVYVDGTLKTLDTDYTVTGLQDDDGGTVTFDSGLALNDVVVISRSTTVERQTGFGESGGADLRGEALNIELTVLIAILQEVNLAIARSVRLSADSTYGGALTLPEPVAGKGLKWADDGLSLENTDVTVDDAIAEAAASAVAADASADAAAASASSASTSASTATTQASNASTSASTATTQASNASASAIAADASADAAALSETNADASADAAAASASSASTSASTATTQASNASTSASTATTQASNASASAIAADASADAAAASAIAADASADAAALSEANAAASAGSIALPSAATNGLKYIRQKATEDGFEYRTLAQTLSDIGAVGMDKARRLLFGRAPYYTDANTITIPAYSGGVDSTGAYVLASSSNITVALNASGAGGLDAGSEASNTWYYVYLIGKTDGTVSAMFSTVNESVSGSISFANASGYTLKRQLPLAVRNDGSSNIIPFVVGDGWPHRPRIHYDVPYRGYSATGTAGVTEFLTNGSSTSFAAASAAAFIPPISQFGFFVLCNAGSANGVAIRPTGSSHTGIEVAGSNIGNPPPIPCKTNSAQSIDYDKIYGAGANIWLAVESYVVTEL